MKIPGLTEEMNISGQKQTDRMQNRKIKVNEHAPLNNGQNNSVRDTFAVPIESVKSASSDKHHKKGINEFQKTLALAKNGDREAQFLIGTIYEVNQNYEMAYGWYERAAKQGNDSAYYSMARFLETGFLNRDHDVPEADLKKAVKYYAIAAVLGNADGQKKLADFYYDGNGVEQDLQNAIEWYENASDRDSKEAQYALGQIYAQQGEYDRAYEYYLAAAGNRHIAAQYELGCLLLKGRGVKADEQEAIRWLCLSLEQGHMPAVIELAQIYKNQNTPEGYRKAFDYYLKAASFSAEAERNVAEFYFHGYGNQPKDGTKAFEWYQKAAEHGDAAAQYMVAGIYCIGNASIGVERDYKKAAVYFKKAADQNHTLAAFNLAMLYKQKVLSSESDYIRAYPYFLIAAENGHSDAMFETAEILWNGLNGTKDINAAIGWYEQCASTENRDAQQKLIEIYRFGINRDKDYSSVVRIVSLKPACDTAANQAAAGEVLRLGGFGITRNYELSYAWYKKAAEQGHVEASYWVAEYLHCGKGVQKDDSAAVIWYEKAAKEDYLEAILALGFMYQEGFGTDDGRPNYEMAVNYHRRGVSKGSLRACQALGYDYYCGQGVEKNPAKAFDLFYTAAQDPNGIASQYMVAKMYEEGAGTEKDLPAAFCWYSKAADHKNADAEYKSTHAEAAYKAGSMLAQGAGVSKDAVKSIPYFQIAAEAGNDLAGDELGNAYLYGLGTEVNYETAYKYVLSGANQGIPRSAYNLGVMYKNGFHVSQSKADAEKWFRSAAEAGSRDAQYELAKIYGARREYDLAFQYYEKAAQQGLAEAQNMCGRYYEEGWSTGIRKNNAQAVGYYTLAADQGYAPGLWNLGLCYYEGSGLIKDYSKAFRYFMQAAGKDYKLACNKVGFMYKIGQGVEKNLDEAVRWYTKAASSPHNMARAQLSLGELYASEELSDFENAVVWYKKAQANSDKEVTVKASRFLGDLLFYGKHVEQNYSEAFRYYSVCADRSDAQIQFNLAEMYYLGLGTGKNAEKAVYWYKKVLDQDAAHVEASRRMGVMYLEGIHVEQNCEKAEELLALAADAGDTDACCRLGVMILEDQCRNHDSGQARMYLEKAANAGVAEAMFRTGVIYGAGTLVRQDYSSALHYIFQAALKGHKEACNKVGAMYELGVGVEKNLDEAVRWYTKAASSPHFLAEAQLNLGALYASDELSDYENAVVWYKKAQGNSDNEVMIRASRWLGDLFFYGKHVEQNYAEAFRYYSVCADESDAQIQFNLAEMYYLGHGTDKSAEKAIDWYQKALERDAEHVEASWRLGTIYLQGIHVEQNFGKAEELLTVAANSNHIGACYRLGLMILENKCKNLDSGKAVKYLEKAADAGVVDAMFLVGTIYAEGRFASQDYARAFQYYLEAASRGDVDAMLEVSDMYAKGIGVARNKNLAKTWLLNAAENGNEEAGRRTGGLWFRLFS